MLIKKATFKLLRHSSVSYRKITLSFLQSPKTYSSLQFSFLTTSLLSLLCETLCLESSILTFLFKWKIEKLGTCCLDQILLQRQRFSSKSQSMSLEADYPSDMCLLRVIASFGKGLGESQP